MGKISKGILGGFIGKVGTVIGGYWRGIEYMRSLSTRRNTTSSPAQLEQQARFGVASRFVQSMKDLLETGFSSQAVRMTGVNSALGYTLKNAIMGTYPSFSIAYPLVLVSRGSLPNVAVPAAVAGPAGTITFNWTDNSGMGKAKSTDKILLVAYSETLNHTIYAEIGVRSAATGVLNVPGFAGQAVQTWISVVSEDGKDIATSMFTGQVTVNS